MFRELISDLLKKIGLTVVEACDGLEAMEKIQASCPDLVVMDIVMPRMNGYELCRWIKNDPQAQNVPVVMCSTKSEAFDVHWGKKQGGDAYIAKPFAAKELAQTVKQLLHRPGS
jgi:twitching motility two-component system response regulator PilH